MKNKVASREDIKRLNNLVKIKTNDCIVVTRRKPDIMRTHTKDKQSYFKEACREILSDNRVGKTRGNLKKDQRDDRKV